MYECRVYFQGPCFVPLFYVPVFMPVPGCFDYSGLVIQFDITCCDPSCFVLLSQNCCSYLGSFIVPYKFLKCQSANQWIKKLWYIYTKEFYTAERKKELIPFATAWMELESIMLSEISQEVRDKYHIISPLTGM